MSDRGNRQNRLFRDKIAISGFAAVALFAMSGPILSAEAPKKDEVFAATTAIKVLGKPLTTYDISWFDRELNKYFVADRDNKTIDIVDGTTKNPTHSDQVFGGIGSGPNGVTTVNHKEIWAGDGPNSTDSPPTKGSVKVFDSSGKLTHTIDTHGTNRVDELCFDPRDQLVFAANNKEPTGKQFISVIATDGPKAHTVVATIPVTDGDSVEQCQWNPETGKIYQNVADANKTLVIDPKTKTIVNKFDIPKAACTGPAGLSIGPHNQILLGCNGTTTNSVIINAHSGVVEATLTGDGGTDEVWFNSGDGHYFIPVCLAACRATTPPTADQFLAVIDSEGFRVDLSVDIAPAAGSGGRIKTVAVDPAKNQVFLPVPAGDGTICSTAPTKINSPDNTTGCIVVLTTKHDDKGSKLVRHEHGEE